MPKVEYGINNCYYSVIKNGEYTAPVRLAGAVSFADSITANEKSINKGGHNIVVDFEYGNRTGELSVFYLPKSFMTDVLGYVDDDGVLVEYDDKHKAPVKFALLFETLTDGMPIRYVYYMCICQKPDFAVSTVTEQVNIEPKRLKLSIQPRPCCGGVRAFVSENDNAEMFNTWFGFM